jgi:RNA polymerase primary sigma factor
LVLRAQEGGGLTDDEPFTLEEIGRRLGITRERVRQVQNAALEGLEPHFRQRGLG